MSALLALRWSAARIASGGAVLCAASWIVAGSSSLAQAEDPPAPELLKLGHGLFLHEWQAGDARSHGGDGLGPVFNARSCVACHDQGGVGGGGSLEANVDVIAPTGRWEMAKLRGTHPGLATERRVVLHLSGTSPDYSPWRGSRLSLVAKSRKHQDVDPLLAPVNEPSRQSFVAAFTQLAEDAQSAPAEVQIERGMALQAKIVAAYQNGGAFEPSDFRIDEPVKESASRANVRRRRAAAHPPAPDNQIVSTGLKLSERNTTPLFGLGQIDRISDEAIEAVALEESRNTPKTAGIVSRLEGNRIGRFGWHAQQARLADFTLTACAVEIGLDLPEHPQAGDPRKPNYHSPGYDMDTLDCVSLVAFVANLPRPVAQAPANVKAAQAARAGQAFFVKIGCAECHRETVGDVVGIYSDLLLHDMGSELSAGRYGAFISTEAPRRAAEKQAAPPPRFVDFAALPVDDREWRTPPLWGVASSAPYLHDGRAATLEEAIAAHGGQGLRSAEMFAKLTPGKQKSLVTFLQTLVAPPTAERIMRGGHGWGGFVQVCGPPARTNLPLVRAAAPGDVARGERGAMNADPFAER